LNLGIEANPQYIKVNSQLTKEKIKKLQMLFKEFKGCVCMDLQRFERHISRIGSTQN
jgi:hypothetical protein